MDETRSVNKGSRNTKPDFLKVSYYLSDNDDYDSWLYINIKDIWRVGVTKYQTDDTKFYALEVLARTDCTREYGLRYLCPQSKSNTIDECYRWAEKHIKGFEAEE